MVEYLNGVLTQGGGGTQEWVVVGELTQSGNADYGEITGLDLDSDKFYMVFFNLINNSGSGIHYALTVNSDHTESNYNRQKLYASGGTVAGSQNSDAKFTEATLNSEGTNGHISMSIDPDGYFQATSVNGDDQSTATLCISHVIKKATVTNITGIRITASASNGFGDGSHVVVCKVRG